MKSREYPPNAFDDLRQVLGNPDHVFEETPLTLRVVEAMQQVPRDAVPDMPDRIVAATAIFLGVPLLSRGGRIRASNVRMVW